jgi:hypothetical protein
MQSNRLLTHFDEVLGIAYLDMDECALECSTALPVLIAAAVPGLPLKHLPALGQPPHPSSQRHQAKQQG